MKKIKKERIKTTFGSDASDDEFYLEYREKESDIFSFLSFSTTSKDQIDVYIGKGTNPTVIDLSDLEELIINSKERLIKAKDNWKKTLRDYPEWE